MTHLPPHGIVLITGIQADGKSTVAQMLAERLPRSVHLRGDLFRRAIVPIAPTVLLPDVAVFTGSRWPVPMS
jgi:dephospho-CoA kinase